MKHIPEVETPGFNEGFELMNLLVADLRDTVALRREIREDLWRCLMIRSLFSAIESIVSHARGRALAGARAGTVSLPPKAERALLEGQYEELDDGTVVWTTRYSRLKDTIRYSLRYYAKALETGTPLQAKAPWPEGFDEVLGVRNSVTHPKRLTDLNVTDRNVDQVYQIVQWIKDLAIWIGQHEQEHVDRIAQGINTSVEEQIRQLERGKAQGDW